MRTVAGMLAAAALALLWAVTDASARRDPTLSAASGAEVIVFEVQNCGYCRRFRQHLGARYLASTSQRLAPMRFIDVTHHDPDAFPLRSQITVLPTIVLLREGKEIDRLEGYPLDGLVFDMVRRGVPGNE